MPTIIVEPSKPTPHRSIKIFPHPGSGAREKAIRQLKRVAIKLALAGNRRDFCVVKRLFRELPELRWA